MTTVTWKHEPDDHDHPAAAGYLALVAAPIADGYHRICASHHVDENSEIPCRLVGWDD